MIDFKEIWSKIVEHVLLYGPQLVTAILTLIIGLWIINTMMKVLFKKIPKDKVDVTLVQFLRSIFGIALKVLLWITVISMLGVKMTSFVAILGAAGLAVGLSLQGSLANFAGGVLIMLLRPFKVGDFIETSGYLGTVSRIQIFNIILLTPDNKTVILPNGQVSNSSLTNFSAEPLRRVDMTFGISYGDDLKKAKSILNDIIKADSRILAEPAPQVAVSALGDSSVDFVVRVWCNTPDYWAIFFDMQEKVKLEFDSQGISIPFPQSDVHLYQHEK